MNNYPAIKKAEKEVLSANARIDLSKTAYLPEVNFSGSYTRMEPVNSMTMPIGGEVYTIDMSPKNIYSAGINLSQNIYDFGRTKKSVELNQNSKLLSQMNIEQIKQQLSLSVARVYYTISYLEKAIQIKDDQLKNLNEHLNLVQKKNATGSATQYDILTTKVKISTIENQKTDLQTSLEVQTAQLNSFLGNAASTALRLKEPTLNEAMEDCIAKIKSGEYDVLANLVPITTLWGKKVSFTAPLMAARQVLIQRIPKDSTSLKLKTKQEELADDTIYISKNSPYKMIINNLSDQLAAPVYITELNENKEELVKMVSEGKIKQTICNEEFAQRLQYDYPNIDYSLPVGFTQQQAWVVDNRSKLLLKELDDFLDDFIGSEAYWKIYNKYY